MSTSAPSPNTAVQMLISVTCRVMCLVSLGGSASMSFINWVVSPHPHALSPGHLSCSGGLHLCHHCPSASGQHPDHGEKPHRSAWLWCPGLLLHLPGQHCLHSVGRLVAICRPLCYTLIMSWGLGQEAECAQLLTPLCSSRELSLFCGDVLPAMGQARAHTWAQEAPLFVVSVTVLTSLFLLFSPRILSLWLPSRGSALRREAQAVSTCPPT